MAMNTLAILRTGERPQTAHQSLVARLMVVTHFVQKQTMDRLSQSHRYKKLSVAYSEYVALLVERDQSPGELAEQLGISKQVCSKTVRELETLGLIRRRANPEDGRSSVLSLSAKGIQLLRDGVEAANGIQNQLADTIGAQRLRQLLDILDRLCVAMGVPLPANSALEDTVATKAGSRPTRLAVLLPRLSKLFRRRLAASVKEKGFSDLRPGVGEMLGMISREGKRLQYIATILGVSKQAVAATAAELEQRGYVTREEDPDDRRQIVIGLSPRGQKLLREVGASVGEVEAAIRTALGEADYRLLDETMTTFYTEITENYDSAGALRARIQQLCRELTDELGMTGARALARQLMTMTRGMR